MLCQSPENRRSLRLRFVGPMICRPNEASHVKLSSGDRERDNHFVKDCLWFYPAVVACGSIRQSSQERVYALAKTELRAPPRYIHGRSAISGRGAISVFISIDQDSHICLGFKPRPSSDPPMTCRCGRQRRLRTQASGPRRGR